MTTATDHDDDALRYEEYHVHRVYNDIAPHFSRTRYKVKFTDVKAQTSTR